MARRRVLRVLTLVLVFMALGALAVIRLAPDDPADWHIDPSAIALRGTPNEILAAPPGVASARPHIALASVAAPPEVVLGRLAEVLAARPRTRLLAGTPAQGMMTWVERSALVGFPDYVTAKVLPVPEGTALVLWSRSRWGYGDFGVNRARVEALLDSLGVSREVPSPIPAQTPGQPSAR